MAEKSTSSDVDVPTHKRQKADRSVTVQPMFQVADVPKSSLWYQKVLDLKSGHGGEHYDALTLEDGTVALQLLKWGNNGNSYEREMSKDAGHGTSLWYETKFFDEAVARILASEAEVVSGPLVNAHANHRELCIRDLDGYLIVVSSTYGDTGKDLSSEAVVSDETPQASVE
jgi:hypothetical protein